MLISKTDAERRDGAKPFPGVIVTLRSKDSANDAVMFSSLVVSNRRSYFLAFAYDAAYDSTIFFTFSRRCLDKNASTLSPGAPRLVLPSTTFAAIFSSILPHSSLFNPRSFFSLMPCFSCFRT